MISQVYPYVIMRRLFLPIFTVTLFMSLPSDPANGMNADVVRGESVELSKDFSFYFHNGNNLRSVVIVPDEIATLVLRGAHWTVPDGLSLQEQRIEIRGSTVHWSEGSRYGSAQGVMLRIFVKVKVNDNATLGDKQLFLNLPGLGTVASLVDAAPRSSPSSPFSSPVLVESFTVFESEAAKWTPSRIAGSIVVVVVILVSLGSLIRGLRRDRRTENS